MTKREAEMGTGVWVSGEDWRALGVQVEALRTLGEIVSQVEQKRAHPSQRTGPLLAAFADGIGRIYSTYQARGRRTMRTQHHLSAVGAPGLKGGYWINEAQYERMRRSLSLMAGVISYVRHPSGAMSPHEAEQTLINLEEEMQGLLQNAEFKVLPEES